MKFSYCRYCHNATRRGECEKCAAHENEKAESALSTSKDMQTIHMGAAPRTGFPLDDSEKPEFDLKKQELGTVWMMRNGELVILHQIVSTNGEAGFVFKLVEKDGEFVYLRRNGKARLFFDDEFDIVKRVEPSKDCEEIRPTTPTAGAWTEDRLDAYAPNRSPNPYPLASNQSAAEIEEPDFTGEMDKDKMIEEDIDLVRRRYSPFLMDIHLGFVSKIDRREALKIAEAAQEKLTQIIAKLKPKEKSGRKPHVSQSKHMMGDW
jgi:hypothetical protein